MPAIFVIGGGVAGPAAALSLRKIFPCHDIHIFEQNKETSVGGHGMLLLPNGIDSLKDLVINVSFIRKNFRPIQSTTIKDRHGNVLLKDEVDEKEKICCCTRQAIVNGLYDTLSELEAKSGDGVLHLYNNKQCIDVEIKDGYVFNLVFSDGSSVDVEMDDLVVRADDYRSILCEALNEPTFFRPFSQVFLAGNINDRTFII